MPSNKKKRKPANQSVRGFATTSTPSKSKVDDDQRVDIAEPIAESKNLDAHNVECNDSLNASVTEEVRKELHELTADELESHLEESNMQLLLEDYGEKCTKDATRQFSRLTTEKRLLRLQSERLEVRSWLPDEHIQEILDLSKAQANIDNLDNEPVRALIDSDVSESGLIVRMWTLEKILGRLRFKQDLIRLVLQSLLSRRQSAQLNVGKESIWGLDECFGIITSLCDPKDLPPYDHQPNDAQPKLNKTMERGKRYEGYEPSGNLPTAAPFRLSREADDSEAEIKMNLDEKSPAPDSESDSDEFVELETLIKKYISLQSQILQLQPDFSLHKHKKSKFKQNESNILPIPKVAKLLAKIHKIESDVLFDEYEASLRWMIVRNQYAQESAERRKYDLDKRNNVDSAAAVKSSPRDALVDGKGDEDEQFDMMGDLFSSLPDIISDPATGASSLVGRDVVGHTITIRDFGKWSGYSPRRVLEEACKARDAACKITYAVISKSTFSFQHSLQIDWSVSQDLSQLIHDSSIISDVAEFSVKLQMKTVAAPVTLQSESYISTIALYLIFGHSPKEEKACLRLPPQWRDLWKEMSLFERKHNDAIDRGVLRQLQNMITDTKSEADFSQVPASRSTEPTTAKEESRPGNGAKTRVAGVVEVNDRITKLWSSKSSSSSYRKMQKQRENLPIWNYRDRLSTIIEDNQVVIVCGETGCGKSTQIPAFILENHLSQNRHCKVYCTEPRRISAISLARRVSEELGEQKMDVGTSKSLVGYVIRLESKITDETRLVYATTGIVMRMLERSDGLDDITHLILDEVHERSLESDFLLIVLRKLMVRRPTLKVVLMSATVDAGRFSHYLGGAPIMNIPGRTFPVTAKYLEDAIEITDFDQEDTTRSLQVADFSDDDDKPENEIYQSESDGLKDYSAKTRKTLAHLNQHRIEYDLVIKLLETIAFKSQYVSFSKAILIFLPGIAEIRRLSNLIQSHPSFSQGWNLCALHSTIATEEQERAFLIPLPGIRKIVLATNIAETGITIPDVTCVIDTGRHKEMRYDERRQLSRLIETFISRSNAKQRRGRAGRVQDGICFHLFTKARHDKLMLEEQRPEMLRLSLQDLVLRVKICKLGGIEETLSEALDPPSSKNIQRAINALVDAKALTTKEDLTPLGRQLARLPLDVFLGKLLVLGTFYQSLDAVLSIAAILSSKSPFSAPVGSRSQADAAKLGFRKGDSDLLTVYNAYSAWRKICCTAGSSEQLFCRKNYLSSQTLSNIEELKAQLMTSIVDAGFVTLNETEKASLNRVRLYSNKRRFVEIPERYMINNANELMLNSVIVWSFYPKLLVRDGKGWKNVVNNQHVSLHPTSVNKGLQQPSKWLSYYHIMQSSNKFYNAHETSAVESMAVVLGCGDAEFKMYAGVIVIDGNRIRFAINTWRAMLAIKTLRSQMQQILAQFFRKPGCALSPEQQAWMDIWQKVFTVEKGNV